MTTLILTQFGNQVLRHKARPLSLAQMKSANTQRLIGDMQHILIEKKLGIGLAAPQVGEGVALAVICIRPTKLRPEVEVFDLVLINPVITDTEGRKNSLWEGCISSGQGKAGLFAKVPRSKVVRVKYYDKTGRQHHQKFTGLPAHVIQHEVDHLNGILFVDRVKDSKTYMTYAEYKKMVRLKRESAKTTK